VTGCWLLFVEYLADTFSELNIMNKSLQESNISTLFKLRQLGVTGSVYNLLQSCLSGRSQFVRLGDFCSDHLHTNSGVPQGSVLGPLLFLVYVNDIGTNIKSSISLFADDTILLCSSKNPSALHTMLSNDLRQSEMWSDLWSVTFNASKTKVFTIYK